MGLVEKMFYKESIFIAQASLVAIEYPAKPESKEEAIQLSHVIISCSLLCFGLVVSFVSFVYELIYAFYFSPTSNEHA